MQTDPSKLNPTTPATHGATFQADPAKPSITLAKPEKFLPLSDVEVRCNLKKSSIYAGGKAKTFPAAVRLTARRVAWKESEIEAWIASRTPAGSK